MEKLERIKVKNSNKTKLTVEEKAELKFNRESNKNRRIYEKEQKLKEKELKLKVKRELIVLNFMLKNDVMYHHHGRQDSTKRTITSAITKVKEINHYQEYDPYIWNYQGQGKNMTSISLLGNLFNSSEFETIYDVPLDGSYMFVIYDSGQRGLGTFNYIKPVLVEKTFEAPNVNPGGFPPITC